MRNWYIYELSYEGVPFYVGFSACPAQRYYSHITVSLSRCYQLIRFCIKHYDKYPDINIVDSCKCKVKIRDLERKRISQRIQEGYALVNLHHAIFDNIELPKYRIIPPQIMERLNYQIKVIEDNGN